MGQISNAERRRNEEAIRVTMDRLLKGDLPPGGSCDLKTLATEAGVTRTAFYPKKYRDGTTRPGPYQHLAEELQQRLRTRREAGEVVDPRIAQIERLKAKVAELKERLAQRDETVVELTTFKELAVSRLAAQHDEIVRLWEQAAAPATSAACPPPALERPRTDRAAEPDVYRQFEYDEGVRQRGLPCSLAADTIGLLAVSARGPVVFRPLRPTEQPVGGVGISSPASSAASGTWNCSRHWSTSLSLMGNV
ncbi:hypothetical protein AB0E04_17990 [Streptomyces sp. NPDC048251]|uniref:hypothetical protein n=1 Tax=Streptomyces sp. NPDC048251 TaxID=3154501 RepID=UPI003447080A